MLESVLLFWRVGIKVRALLYLESLVLRSFVVEINNYPLGRELGLELKAAGLLKVLRLLLPILVLWLALQRCGMLLSNRLASSKPRMFLQCLTLPE